MRAAKVIQPERRIVFARIVFDERELRPTHRAIVPQEADDRLSVVRTRFAAQNVRGRHCRQAMGKDS
jgi:hypothetical protein